jgi:hypothetical protein
MPGRASTGSSFDNADWNGSAYDSALTAPLSPTLDNRAAAP